MNPLPALSRSLLAASCFVAVCVAPASIARAADTADAFQWRPITIGGGGWVTGLVVHPKQRDLVYARTDVGGAYKWDAAASRWVQLVTVDRFPADFVADRPDRNPGVSATVAYSVESIAIAPSDPSIVLLAAGTSLSNPGHLFKSTDGGASFRLLGLEVPMHGNIRFRYSDERLAVKPDDASVMLYGSRDRGLWRSADGGESWQQIPLDVVPAGAKVGDAFPGVISVDFDPATPARVYAAVATVGVFRSDDAGLTWREILGGGRWPVVCKVAGGRLFAAGTQGQFGLRIYDPAGEGTWTTHFPGQEHSVAEIAIDPRDPNLIHAITGGGFAGFHRSTDGGRTWTRLDTHTRNDAGRANFVSRHGWKMSSDLRTWLSIGALEADPHHPGRLWFAEGMGVWRADGVTAATTAPVFHDVSDGIEEMVATDVLAIGGRVITSVWDRVGFVHDDLSVAPAAQVGLTNRFASGWSLATSAADPNFVAMVVTDHRFTNGPGIFAGQSSDAGRTWTQFLSIGSDQNNTPDELRFGELVVSATDTRRMVWLPRYGKQILRHTADGGRTWQDAPVALEDWNAFFFGNRRRLAADTVAPDTFYLYQWKTGALDVSTDGGATWQTRFTGLPTYTYHSQLKGAPGARGHLWFARGRDHAASSSSLLHSTDGGATWQPVPFFDQAWAIGFGRGSEARDPSAVIVYGRAAGADSSQAWGVYRSLDQGSTWTRLSGRPLGLFDVVTTINGDPDRHDRVYIGFSGNSFAYGEPRHP